MPSFKFLAKMEMLHVASFLLRRFCAMANWGIRVHGLMLDAMSTHASEVPPLSWRYPANRSSKANTTLLDGIPQVPSVKAVGIYLLEI
ncbi:hypothetical protein TWF751_000491 [Orbilia oligospora]|nr:hypothetical protein TWF751_000491 [Orbilia oligospora]